MIELGSIVAKMKLDISDFAFKMKEAEAEIKSTESKFSGFSDIGKRMSNIGDSLSIGVTAPIMGAGVAAGKFFMDFEEGMAKISTVADATQVPIDDMGKSLVEMSNKSGMATSDLQSGLYDVISAGVQTKDSMQYLEVAVKSAKGGFTDTATAVDGLTSTLNAYGIEASKANDIANQMMVAQNLGKTTFGEMASVMGNVAPTAAALKVKTDELFSSLAVLTANGIKTSEATTGLKAAFSNIAKPTADAEKAAKSLGIEFTASAVATKGWMPFLADVKDKLKEAAPAYDDALMRQNKYNKLIEEAEKSGSKNSEQLKDWKGKLKEAKDEVKNLTQAQDSQVGAFATMFGSVEALNTVLTLTSDQGMSLYGESMKQMGDGVDRLDDAYKKMSETSGDKMKKGLNSLKNAGIELGASLAPIMEKLGEAFSKVSKIISGMSEGQKDFAVGLALTLAAVGPVLSVFGRTVQTVKDMSAAYKGAKIAIDAMKNSTLLKAAADKIATAGQWAFNAAINANPISIAVIAIAALIGALVYLFYHNKKVHDAIIETWNAIKTFFSGLGKWFVDTFDAIGKGFNKFVEDTKKFFSDGWTKLKADTVKVFTSIKDFFVDIFVSIKNKVVDTVTGFVDKIKSIFVTTTVFSQAHFENFRKVFVEIWETIKTYVLGIVLLLIDLLTLNFTKFGEDFKKITEKLKEHVVAAWTALKDAVKFLCETLITDLKFNWNHIKEWLATTMTNIWTSITDKWKEIKSDVSSTINSLIESIKTSWDNLKSSVSTKGTEIYNDVKNTWNDLLNWFGGLPDRLYNYGSNMFTSMKNGVNSTISNVKSSVSSGINNAIEVITNLPSRAWTWGADFIDGLVNGIKSKITKIKDAVSGVGDTIRSYLHFSVPDVGPLTDYESWMPDFMDGMAKGIRGNKGVVIDELRDLTSGMKIATTDTASSMKQQVSSTSLISSMFEQMRSFMSNNQLQAAGGINLNIKEFNNNRKQDVQQLAEEFEFYRQQSSKSKGGN